jgi:hypothetical protein
MDAASAQLGLQLTASPIPEPAAGIWRIICGECRGRENAIPMPELAGRLGVSTRTVQSEIELLILEYGKPIGSSCGKVSGYYMITDEADLELVFRNRINRAISNFRVAYALKREAAVHEMQGQMSMVEVAGG